MPWKVNGLGLLQTMRRTPGATAPARPYSNAIRLRNGMSAWAIGRSGLSRNVYWMTMLGAGFIAPPEAFAQTASAMAR